MTRDKSISIVMSWLVSGNCAPEDFLEALKNLSKDEREKVYLAVERQFQTSEGGIRCFTR